MGDASSSQARAAVSSAVLSAVGVTGGSIASGLGVSAITTTTVSSSIVVTPVSAIPLNPVIAQYSLFGVPKMVTYTSTIPAFSASASAGVGVGVGIALGTAFLAGAFGVAKWVEYGKAKV